MQCTYVHMYMLWCPQVKPDTVIEVWKAGHDSRAAVTKAGLKAIYSACWYLNLFHYGADWGQVSGVYCSGGVWV